MMTHVEKKLTIFNLTRVTCLTRMVYFFYILILYLNFHYFLK